MELYFSPLACSLATRIALYEAGASARFTEVDTKHKRLSDGSDFLAINPLGQVPVLRTDAGELITENPVVLQYVADRVPQSGLAPSKDSAERYSLQMWLNFVTSELHKLVFTPLLTPHANEGAKAFALEESVARLNYLNKYLEGREFLLDRFTVADAYLVTVLNWTRVTPIDLTKYPAVHTYHLRMHQRPALAKAFGEEMVLYKESQARRDAA